VEKVSCGRKDGSEAPLPRVMRGALRKATVAQRDEKYALRSLGPLHRGAAHAYDAALAECSVKAHSAHTQAAQRGAEIRCDGGDCYTAVATAAPQLGWTDYANGGATHATASDADKGKGDGMCGTGAGDGQQRRRMGPNRTERSSGHSRAHTHDARHSAIQPKTTVHRARARHGTTNGRRRQTQRPQNTVHTARAAMLGWLPRSLL